MAIQSYPLIGVDKDGNKHPIEFFGVSQLDAAKKACERRFYVKVLSNVSHHRPKNGDYNGRVVFERKDTDLDVPRDGTSVLANAIKEKFEHATHSVLQELRDLGYKLQLSVGKHTGLRDSFIVDAGSPVITEHVRNMLNTNKKAIVEALIDEEKKTAGQSPPPDPNDPYKGAKGKHDVVLKMLGQMPQEFTLALFKQRLLDCGYTVFAENHKLVSTGLEYPVTLGIIKRVGTGKFRIEPEKLKSAVAKAKARNEAIEASPPAPPAPPPQPPPSQQADLPLAATTVAKDSPPEPPLLVVPTSAPKPDVTHPSPAQPISIVETESIPKPALAALITLAEDFAAIENDEAVRLAQQLQEQLAAFESEMLARVEAFESETLARVEAVQVAAKPLIEYVQNRNLAREQFRRTVTQRANP